MNVSPHLYRSTTEFKIGSRVIVSSGTQIGKVTTVESDIHGGHAYTIMLDDGCVLDSIPRSELNLSAKSLVLSSDGLFHCPCVGCDYKTPRKTDMKRHWWKIHNISVSSAYKYYPCVECGLQFKSCTSLKNHMAKKHNIGISSTQKKKKTPTSTKKKKRSSIQQVQTTASPKVQTRSGRRQKFKVGDTVMVDVDNHSNPFGYFKCGIVRLVGSISYNIEFAKGELEEYVNSQTHVQQRIAFSLIRSSANLSTGPAAVTPKDIYYRLMQEVPTPWKLPGTIKVEDKNSAVTGDCDGVYYEASYEFVEKLQSNPCFPFSQCVKLTHVYHRDVHDNQKVCILFAIVSGTSSKFGFWSPDFVEQKYCPIGGILTPLPKGLVISMFSDNHVRFDTQLEMIEDVGGDTEDTEKYSTDDEKNNEGNNFDGETNFDGDNNFENRDREAAAAPDIGEDSMVEVLPSGRPSSFFVHGNKLDFLNGKYIWDTENNWYFSVDAKLITKELITFKAFDKDTKKGGKSSKLYWGFVNEKTKHCWQWYPVEDKFPVDIDGKEVEFLCPRYHETQKKEFDLLDRTNNETKWTQYNAALLKNPFSTCVVCFRSQADKSRTLDKKQFHLVFTKRPAPPLAKPYNPYILRHNTESIRNATYRKDVVYLLGERPVYVSSITYEDTSRLVAKYATLETMSGQTLLDTYPIHHLHRRHRKSKNKSSPKQRRRGESRGKYFQRMVMSSPVMSSPVVSSPSQTTVVSKRPRKKRSRGHKLMEKAKSIYTEIISEEKVIQKRVAKAKVDLQKTQTEIDGLQVEIQEHKTKDDYLVETIRKAPVSLKKELQQLRKQHQVPETKRRRLTEKINEHNQQKVKIKDLENEQKALQDAKSFYAEGFFSRGRRGIAAVDYEINQKRRPPLASVVHVHSTDVIGEDPVEVTRYTKDGEKIPNPTWDQPILFYGKGGNGENLITAVYGINDSEWSGDGTLTLEDAVDHFYPTSKRQEALFVEQDVWQATSDSSRSTVRQKFKTVYVTNDKKYGFSGSAITLDLVTIV